MSDFPTNLNIIAFSIVEGRPRQSQQERKVKRYPCPSKSPYELDTRFQSQVTKPHPSSLNAFSPVSNNRVLTSVWVLTRSALNAHTSSMHLKTLPASTPLPGSKTTSTYLEMSQQHPISQHQNLYRSRFSREIEPVGCVYLYRKGFIGRDWLTQPLRLRSFKTCRQSAGDPGVVPVWVQRPENQESW